MLTFAIIYIASCIITGVWLCWRAPEGYETPGIGFRYGKPSQHPFTDNPKGFGSVGESGFHATPISEGAQHDVI